MAVSAAVLVRVSTAFPPLEPSLNSNRLNRKSRTKNAEKPPFQAIFLPKVVGVRGLEPRASCSQSRRATNCATPRYEVVKLSGRFLPKQARYQLRYTRLWNCFICGLSCGLSRFLTNGFAEIVPASDGVPAVCEVGLFPSWMGGIRSQITRAANYATFGHRYFSRPRAFFPTYVRQYTLRSAALALWHHLLLDRGQHDGFILYLSILPVSPPKSSLFASGRYVGKAVRRLWGLRTA